MSSPVDPHDPHNELDRQDRLTLMALGETVDAAFAEHEAGCRRCQAELTALTATVALARSSSREVAAALPSEQVWDAIAAATAPTPVALPRRRRMTWKTGLIAAAVVVLVGFGGYLLGRDTSPGQARVAAHAVLAAQPGGPGAVSGSAVVTRISSGYTVSVTTHSLPIRPGYYAVWVYDPAINHMINIGALNADGTGQFSLPPGVQLSDYNVIDVSAQNFDGNPAHQQSVLQGPMTK